MVEGPQSLSCGPILIEDETPDTGYGGYPAICMIFSLQLCYKKCLIVNRLAMPVTGCVTPISFNNTNFFLIKPRDVGVVMDIGLLTNQLGMMFPLNHYYLM